MQTGSSRSGGANQSPSPPLTGAKTTTAATSPAGLERSITGGAAEGSWAIAGPEFAWSMAAVIDRSAVVPSPSSAMARTVYEPGVLLPGTV